MIRDLIALFETVRGAQSEQERDDAKRALEDAVREEIRELFADPAYPMRRRSFGAIRQRLAIYDSEPEALTRILFAMNARRVKGDGDEALWELRDTPGAPPADPPRRMRWQTIAGVIALGAVAVFGVTNWTILRGWLQGSEFASYRECAIATNGNMRKLTECRKLFPLPSP